MLKSTTADRANTRLPPKNNPVHRAGSKLCTRAPPPIVQNKNTEKLCTEAPPMIVQKHKVMHTKRTSDFLFDLHRAFFSSRWCSAAIERHADALWDRHGDPAWPSPVVSAAYCVRFAAEEEAAVSAVGNQAQIFRRFPAVVWGRRCCDVLLLLRPHASGKCLFRAVLDIRFRALPAVLG